MSYSILIVDDSATTRAIIKRTIQMTGLPVSTVREASNGREAILSLAAAPVDLVLADLHMPEMDGEEMTRHLRAHEMTAAIPVVVISAEPNAQRIANLRAMGIKGYLRKPFTPEHVRELIQQVLGGDHANN